MTAPIPRDIPDLPVIPGRRTNLMPSSAPAGAVAPPVRRPLIAVYRLLLALAALAAVTVEILLGGPARVLSHFTIQSTLLLAAVTLASAGRAWTARRPLPGALTGAALLYVVAAALLHHVLLTDAAPAYTMTGPADPAGTAGTLTALAPPALHTVLPVAAVLDWLLLSPPARIRLVHAAAWLLYPTAHLVLAPVIGGLLPAGPARYLYPFQDPGRHGHPYVLGVSLLLLLALYCLALALIALDRTRPDPLRLGAKTGFRLRPPVG
ncbi:Pr6Pr family membrane protein [Streptomyces sp. MAR25Y5]|uniref:Pr6Pr family membrane protein n=1 Tax=Streptomyces sp. MAR25Y5 TaxID=2962028 RepID=UPI0020B87C3F|nr:Pr6Pr family membrane protein [Streptomyces sp. MAR25Y5]MCP3769634.1 Pr6Pr family membrane protein [Streptomyces sp. MAR25Y5]